MQKRRRFEVQSLEQRLSQVQSLEHHLHAKSLERRFRQVQSLEQRLAVEAKRISEKAELLPPGFLREQLLQMTRQAERSSHTNS
jgi:hypothetical protein